MVDTIEKDLIKIKKHLEIWSVNLTTQNEIYGDIYKKITSKNNLVVDNRTNDSESKSPIKVNEYVDPSVPDTESCSITENRGRNINCNEDKNNEEALEYSESKIGSQHNEGKAEEEADEPEKEDKKTNFGSFLKEYYRKMVDRFFFVKQFEDSFECVTEKQLDVIRDSLEEQAKSLTEFKSKVNDMLKEKSTKLGKRLSNNKEYRFMVHKLSIESEEGARLSIKVTAYLNQFKSLLEKKGL